MDRILKKNPRIIGTGCQNTSQDDAAKAEMIDQSTPPPKIATTERNENKSRLLPNEINAKLLD